MFKEELRDLLGFWERITLSLFHSQKKSDLHKKSLFHHVFDSFVTAFPIFMAKSESLPSLFAPSLIFKEQWEKFAHGCSLKRLTLSH